MVRGVGMMSRSKTSVGTIKGPGDTARNGSLGREGTLSGQREEVHKPGENIMITFIYICVNALRLISVLWLPYY